MTLNQLTYVIKVAETGNMHTAAEALYISQPALSTAIRNLENELGIQLFVRDNNKIYLTKEGTEFITYAKQVSAHFQLIQDKFSSKNKPQKNFSISTQHYSFAVDIFVKMIKEETDDSYKFSFFETNTREIIENVKNFRSEIGILYVSNFNEIILKSIFKKSNLEFHSLFKRDVYVYLSNNHPLVSRSVVNIEDLAPYPCILHDYGETNPIFYSEDLLSSAEHKKIVQITDKATACDILFSANGYIIGSGVRGKISDRCSSVKFDTSEVMDIGYIKRKDTPLSDIAQKYIEELKKLPKN